MSYFNNFPKASIPFTISGEQKNILLVDITKNIRFIQASLAAIQLFDNYAIKDGETPEIISDLFYGSPDYHWIIMLANQKYDYINDFPKTQLHLDTVISEKYGSLADAPAYYSKNGRIVDYGTVGSVEVTNRMHETIINESKRSIKIIPKDYINTIVTEFLNIING